VDESTIGHRNKLSAFSKRLSSKYLVRRQEKENDSFVATCHVRYGLSEQIGQSHAAPGGHILVNAGQVICIIN